MDSGPRSNAKSHRRQHGAGGIRLIPPEWPRKLRPAQSPGFSPLLRMRWTSDETIDPEPARRRAGRIAPVQPGPWRRPPAEPGPWPVARAEGWGREHPWLVGCNFSPSTAINQLEMWQAGTFDLPTIDRELGWAEGLGFNSVRVFLHHLLWNRTRRVSCRGSNQFLAAADRHKDRRDVRAPRRRLGSVPPSGQAARPPAGPAQLGLGGRARPW